MECKPMPMWLSAARYNVHHSPHYIGETILAPDEHTHTHTPRGEPYTPANIDDKPNSPAA